MKQLIQAAIVFAVVTDVSLGALSAKKVEFFESRIRPILAQECYECHSEATKAKGGLLLDTRGGWEKGGDSGESIIVPGNPDDSLLLKSIAHEIEDLEMPEAGAKLEQTVLSDFRKWIGDGAIDPRDTPPSAEQLAADTDWTAVRERREGWWSFQAIVRADAPEVSGVDHPVDRFIRKALQVEGLPSVEKSDARSLHRRISFNLIGLPPTREESESFLEAWELNSEQATESLVDRLLGDVRFGEKWARHWMDWLRYADSHGSEGDPAIPHSWQYRDYLIRAINADVPYDQLVREHIAGDLLEVPRINEKLQLNESAIGTAHLRMVFHGFAPTDALDERVRFTDDQINVVTKAFMGLTVSCARCHNHKFDAISEADYYALFGIFTSSLPATIAVDAPGVLDVNSEAMASLKKPIQQLVGQYWLESIEGGSLDWKIDEAIKGQPSNALSLLAKTEEGGDVATIWEKSRQQFDSYQNQIDSIRSSEQVRRRWDLKSSEEVEKWTRSGKGLDDTLPVSAGAFSVGLGGALVEQIVPGGLYSNLLSSRHAALLASAPFDLDGEYDLYLNVVGDNASSRYAVQNYPRRGTVFPNSSLDKGEWIWADYNKVDYWDGDSIHIEMATAGESAVLVKGGDRSWFGIREALLIQKGEPGPARNSLESFGPLFAGRANPQSFEDAKAGYLTVLRGILERWGPGQTLNDPEALFLNDCLAAGVLPNDVSGAPTELAKLIQKYQKLEESVPLPTRAPGLIDRPGRDHPLYVRGNHKQPGEIIPRRFLEAIDETPYEPIGSGRLEFSEDLLREDNPFTARMIVNRIWHHLFGAGLVATSDNFGRLGEEPSHPELLDYMADRFRGEQNWSIKTLVRDLVLTDTWQQSSVPPIDAQERDPDNRLLSYYPLRRLEAEAIRDAVHFVSGRLDETQYGEPISANVPRRAIYLKVKRNSLDPLMTTFDFPVPASTVGRRDATNVPAQSLTLLNDPYLIQQAGFWASDLTDQLAADAEDDEIIRLFFLSALNREPSERELTQSRDFLYAVDHEYGANREKLTRIEGELDRFRNAIQTLESPLRQRLLNDRSDVETTVDLKPISHWEFGSDLNDQIGGLSGTAKGTARIEDGALVLDGEGFVETMPLRRTLKAKSLEVRLQLDDLTQRFGGAMTVQTLNGGFFDSIVYAEKKQAKWLVGSNNHHRTLDLGAGNEKEAGSRPVHLVATFEEDGTIRFYRNGVIWGEPTRKSDLLPFKKGDAAVVFGIRHGTQVAPKRMLAGRIFHASLYDRALTASEVALAFAQGKSFVSQGEILAELSEDQQSERKKLVEKISDLEGELSGLLGAESDSPLERQRWQDFALAMFNLKEFIYLR